MGEEGEFTIALKFPTKPLTPLHMYRSLTWFNKSCCRIQRMGVITNPFFSKRKKAIVLV
jgi:hypothetical protein